ncbi:alpha/beta fold hydrolase [Pseudonocardia sp. CA-107938]|uniref:alpha/beta fold hydrolase n=1 Tax=Pseudonocardia sp. CA-107938 TaxID=3240021 RepID=UPI003D92A6B4
MRLPGPWRQRFVSANGIRLHVVEQGAGPLVVLLHGFPEFWWAWRRQLPGLAAQGYRVAAIDLRGYGESDKPPRGYDLWTLAGDVSGLIGALGEVRAAVVGHGWGGLIGWTLTALHPRRVSRLVSIGSAHPRALRAAMVRDPRGQGAATASYALGFQVPRRPERSLRADDAARVERIMRDWSGPGWTATADFAAAVAHYRTAMAVPNVAHCTLEYHRWVARSQLRSDGRRFAEAVARASEVPVLQVHGAVDPCVLPATAAASARWAGADHQLEVLDGCGHFPHEEQPDRVTGLVADFLRR